MANYAFYSPLRDHSGPVKVSKSPLSCRFSIVSCEAMSQTQETVGEKILGLVLLAVALPVVLLFAIPILILFFTYRLSLYFLIWLVWLPRGRDVLVVYSDSPIWRDYMTGRIIPLVQERAVVLNWSERRKWPSWSLAVRGFKAFGGEREFNPLVVLFRPFCTARIFRFWPAFKDWKHGHPEAVEKLQRDLMLAL
ncbi:MAG: hypothetical protein HY525_03725 [Betaproteobacteria bacterium]|nr:hypothetical protein [Betaproteobacteria bacterium]